MNIKSTFEIFTIEYQLSPKRYVNNRITEFEDKENNIKLNLIIWDEVEETWELIIKSSSYIVRVREQSRIIKTSSIVEQI